MSEQTLNPLAELAKRYTFNNMMLGAAADGFTDENWDWRPADGLNTARWIVGHILVSRHGQLDVLGEPVERASWEEGFGRGKPSETPADTPDGASMIEIFAAAGDKLATKLASLTPEEAAREVSLGFPDGSKDVGGAAHFFFLHETYHIGQVGLIRRLHGLPRFA